MTSTEHTPLLYNLPVELLEAILANLTYPDLANAFNVSHALRTLCSSGSPAISPERSKLLTLRSTVRASPKTKHALIQIQRRAAPFLLSEDPSDESTGFNRQTYLDRIAATIDTTLPAEFSHWLLETPHNDIIGWHWPGLKGEHDRTRHEELGIDFLDVLYSRHMKPGYTLLPSARVMDVEDPDYAEFNDTDLHFYPGSWQCNRVKREDTRVRALQVWADMSGFAPRITLLILSGSERWDGVVWLTEMRSGFDRHAVGHVGAEVGGEWCGESAAGLAEAVGDLG